MDSAMEDAHCHAFGDGEQVEFRCMIQDTFGTEIYSLPQGGFADRTLFYCINIPGENNWVRDHSQQSIKNEFMTNSNRLKIKEMDLTDRNQRIGFNLVNKSYPLANGINSACLIKLYDLKLADDYKVNDIIHVVGNIEKQTPVEGDNPDQNQPESGGQVDGDQQQKLQHDLDFEPSSDLPDELVPRVHVTSIKKMSHINPLLPHDLAQNSLDKTNILLARARLSTILTELLGGDSLTTEYLIMYLLSGIYKRKDVTTLGQMTLNLIGFKPNMKFLIEKLCDLFNKITTHSTKLELSIANLTNLCFTPKKDHENNKMIAGALQLPLGHYLMLDETALSEGTLNAQGTDNIATLAHIIQWQRHNYNFQFHRVEIETDLRILVFSEGKSLLPIQYSIKLEKNDDVAVELMKQACDSVNDFLTEDLLNMFRVYITSLMNFKDYKIPEQVQQTIEQNFVEWRKQKDQDGNPVFSTDDLSSYLSLARILTISKGETELTLEIWKELCDKESERQSRLQSK